MLGITANSQAIVEVYSDEKSRLAECNDRVGNAENALNATVTALVSVGVLAAGVVVVKGSKKNGSKTP
jgi:flagellar basal body L-ring protein FlgH